MLQQDSLFSTLRGAATGNKLASLEDIQHLQRCQALVTLDLSSNKLCEEEAVQLIMSLPLSLLKLNGNPVVSYMQ